MKKGLTGNDPRGLISEAYRIEGILGKDCRTIFLDWCLGLNSDQDPATEVKVLYDFYSKKYSKHPMTEVLKEGLKFSAVVPKRRKR